jgi:hypothetical protein
MAFDFRNAGVLTTANLVLGSVLVIAGAVWVATRQIRRRKNEKAKAQTTPYVLQFPPSRRHTLASMSRLEKYYVPSTVTPEVLKARALPSTSKADFSKDNQYTPTGFSTQDLRALGRFPDYSILSGVPHPEPVGPDFDINKAVFRPFRPFRWVYHQHMGELAQGAPGRRNGLRTV